MAHDIPQPIAIIGSACRLPGRASSPSKLWELLLKPKDLLKEVPRDRFHWESIYREDGLHGTSRTKHGYWLDENIRLFDTHFFGINPAEAETLDPQHRLLLENVYEAIEAAGLTLEDLQGTDTGVFVGMMSRGYFNNANKDLEACSGQILSTGTSRAMASNRISYTFDFRGPSMTIDTACSSSMMAVHLAVASLRRNESTTAFACGTHLNLEPNDWVSLTKMNMISPDGRSKHFDETANGYGRGEGVGVVCLKRLDAAIRDGDHIECVIRETGTNQDGHTKGITMPSAEAQAALIRKTYNSAGLDPTQVGSRPSFFEAHGTGTYVGDPLEAEAVQAAFYPPGHEYSDDEILYIGSIKTILGHTEGTAGIAGLLRAALAVRYGSIPPNFLYTRMNPRVAQHGEHLRVVTAANPWPTLPVGCPRRASINSFGFGGSNVHIIVESYENPKPARVSSVPSFGAIEPVFTPFTFSATSERALMAVMENYLDYLEDPKSSVSLRDLAWTMQYKRTQFPLRCAISAGTLEELNKKLRKAINSHLDQNGAFKLVRASQFAQPRIMGIFTGQGSQWPGMGKDLIERSPYAYDIIAKLDQALASLPEPDRPGWKLKDELAVDSSRSRMNEAALSQPLTTAIQILLVDLLDIAGVKLGTIVGHSSGEIAAAYAAGMITSEDAIRISYYRGLHSKNAGGTDGCNGAMLAAFLTPEQAMDLCDLPEFQGCIVPAAYNGPSIVTLSGDADAIDRASQMLGAQNIFAKKLNVEKAYHSHHMQPCIDPYLQSLDGCGVPVLPPFEDSPIWFSSVHPGKRMGPSKTLYGSYWANNLISTVHFSEAITTAISETGVPDIFLEIGPHSALQKPVMQIVADVAKNGTVYTGLLKRGSDAISTFSEAIGVIWARFGRSAVNFMKLETLLSGGSSPALSKDLPTYPWLHDREHWWESRFLRHRFQAIYPPNELLGEELSMGAQHETKWRSFLQPQAVPWLLEHKLNGVAILPGAAYVSMVATAARRIYRKQNIVMIEVQDLHFKLPLTFPDDRTSIETILTVVNIKSDSQQGQADFVFDFCSHQRQDELMTAARGSITVRFGKDTDRAHPKRLLQRSTLTELDPELFYGHLEERGYQYTGAFKSITTLRRRMDFSTGKMEFMPTDMTFHPALLDGLFQATFAAENYPGDSAMLDFRVPSLVRSIKVFPARCDEMATFEKKAVGFQVSKTGPFEYSGLLFGANGSEAVVQMEGFCTAPFRMTTPKDDLKLFSRIVWKPYVRDARSLASSCVLATHERQTALSCERVAFYYLRRLNEIIPHEEEQYAAPHLRHILAFARLCVSECLLGLQPHVSRAWLNDTEEDIGETIAQYPDLINMRLIEAVGRAYPLIIRGQLSALNVLTENNMLIRLYQEGLGFPEANSTLTKLVSAISHQSPNMRILEVGAGTGSVTGGILKSATYSSYAFTDVSPAFLGAAKEKFKRYSNRMTFAVLDIEKGFESQGFKDQSFEVIVASNVLHALSDTKAALVRLRQLLHPGGYLVCLELPDTCRISDTVIMGGLPGWWHGAATGRTWSPALTEQQWDHILRSTGFAGLDAITPFVDPFQHSYRVFVSQAVDERVLALREPLTHRLPKSRESVMIIGGSSLAPSPFPEGVRNVLLPSFQEVILLPSLTDIKDDTVIPYVVLCLVELEEPIFRDMTIAKWLALQKLFSEATDVVWVTTGSKCPTKMQDVYRQMMIGLGRTVRNEFRDLRMRFLDLDHANAMSAESISQAMLEWYMLGQWAAAGWHDQVLFPHDVELAIQSGNALTPSVTHIKAKNDRYNSQHRRIIREVQPYETPAEVVYSPSTKQYDVHETLLSPINAAADTMIVKVLYSTLYALKLKDLGFLFIGLGVCEDGRYAVVLSESNSSILPLPRHAVNPLMALDKPDKSDLWAVAAYIISERVVAACDLTGKLLALVSDATFLSVIREQAAKRNKSAVFVTSNPDFGSQDAIFLHHNTMEIQIRQAIPDQIGLLINLSNRPDDKTLFRRVSRVLRDSCTKIKAIDTVLRTNSSRYGYTGTLTDQFTIGVQDERRTRVARSPSQNSFDLRNINVLSPTQITKLSIHDPLTILDWTATSRIPITIRPATESARFDPNKSYIIIGSSDLAQSVCELMINNGAKHIVLASRNPHGLSDWVEDMAFRGAHVDLTSVDITDANSVDLMFASIRTSSAPRIAGVIHMGLALKDAAFSKMTFEDLQIATDVKAKGSLLLHEQLLQEKLDFFVLTSSISYVAGNPGQANYNCGNAFMTGLAHYRRNIGLPASVVHLGHVTGVGYISRLSQANGTNNPNSDEVQKKRLYPISERDLHQIYAEAVMASPVDSDMSPEIVTGFRELTPEALEQSVWAKQPIFAHLTTQGTRDTTTAVPKPQLSVRELLKEELSATSVTSAEAPKTPVHEIIRIALLDRLGVLLQVDVKEIDEEISLLDMGIDSLVASEIGSWARKELRVQIPHSMIFGGASVREIVEFAGAHIDKGWVASRNGEGKEKQKEKEKEHV